MKTKQKGITLIALIITVIVLLILAGTAISIAINGGDIFSKATTAREEWNNAVADEESIIESYVDLAEQYFKKINRNKPVILNPAELTDKYNQNVIYSGYEATDIQPTNWKLFYADDTNVYIISTNGIQNGVQTQWFEYDGELVEPGISLNSEITDWSRNGEYNEIFYKTRNVAAYLSNPENWERYCSPVANWAIGGPTVDIYKASYDATHSSPISIIAEQWRV